MDVNIEKSWKTLLEDEFKKPYFSALVSFVRQEYKTHQVFPPGKEIFNAFEQCPYDQTKVVIIGQDPYHGEGQAHGLCFSVNDHVPFPPSLINIYKELENDLGIKPPNHGNLTRWSTQGVLLLNATLTVRSNSPGSHQGRGWEVFTDSVITHLNKGKSNLVFLLWGSYAQNKGQFINTERHLVIKSVHPSPLAAHRGFFGSKPFSRTNDYLIAHGLEPIRW